MTGYEPTPEQVQAAEAAWVEYRDNQVADQIKHRAEGTAWRKHWRDRMGYSDAKIDKMNADDLAELRADLDRDHEAWVRTWIIDRLWEAHAGGEL